MVTPFYRGGNCGSGWLEDLPQSPWSLAHRVAMEPPIQVIREQARTRQKYHWGCLRPAQKWDRSGDW